MNLVDNKRKLRTTFQVLIIVAMVFYLMHLRVPKSFNSQATYWLIFTIISCVGLIAIALRVNCKNVKRWEMVLYYLLNVVFVYIIVHGVMELCYITVDIKRANIPYDTGTEEYYNAYDNIEEIGLIAGFKFVLCGIPSIIMTVIFTIIGIIQTCIQSQNSNTLKVEDNQVLTSDLNNIEHNKKDNKNIQTIKANYCSYCGQKINSDANFCKYCGKEIK